MYIHELSIQYNTDKKHIIQAYFNYVIINHSDIITSKLLNFMEKNIHNQDASVRDRIDYFVYHTRLHYLSNASDKS